MKKTIPLDEVVQKLNAKKAFPIYKKKITKDDLKQIFTDKELKKRPMMKTYTLVFGLFVAVTGLFTADIARLIVGLTFALGSLFMENQNQKFLKNTIKKDSEHLIKAYESGLVSFHLLGGFGTISSDDTQIVKDE